MPSAPSAWIIYRICPLREALCATEKGFDLIYDIFCAEHNQNDRRRACASRMTIFLNPVTNSAAFTFNQMNGLSDQRSSQSRSVEQLKKPVLRTGAAVWPKRKKARKCL